MLLNDSHVKLDWLDVGCKRQQVSVKKAENSTAGLYCIAIKDISPRECHYLYTSIYVQMAPNLLLPPPPTGSVCVWRCSHSRGLCLHSSYSTKSTQSHYKDIVCQWYGVANKPWHVSRLREMLHKTLTSTKRR